MTIIHQEKTIDMVTGVTKEIPDTTLVEEAEVSMIVKA